jgi:hypothetical protein
MTADEAKVILKDEINNDLIKCIYEYWKGKRLKYVNFYKINKTSKIFHDLLFKNRNIH